MESSTETKTYDFIVIGAGSGGMACAKRAAGHKKKVLLIENKKPGGTCVNVGCVPKKVMFNLSSFLEEAKLMEGYGVKGVKNLTLDFKEFKEKRDGFIKRLNGIYMNSFKDLDIDYMPGTASFVSDHIVKVSTDANT